MLESRSKAQKT